MSGGGATGSATCWTLKPIREVLSIPVVALAIALAPACVRAADADNGRTLAERWCASCHVVAPNQRQGSPDVAPFSEVAKVPSFDEHELAYFLLAPHPTMPEMALSLSAAADIAAYIAKQAP